EDQTDDGQAVGLSSALAGTRCRTRGMSKPRNLVHRVRSRAYAETQGVGEFDFVLLGLGEDGHTASLFGGHDWGRHLNHRSPGDTRCAQAAAAAGVPLRSALEPC